MSAGAYDDDDADTSGFCCTLQLFPRLFIVSGRGDMALGTHNDPLFPILLPLLFVLLLVIPPLTSEDDVTTGDVETDATDGACG